VHNLTHRFRSGRQRLVALLLLGAALTVMGACAEDNAPASVTDSSGVELTFETPPQRIVSYSPGATEILFAIGAGDLVVAADEFSDYPAETADLPKVAYSTPDPEAALSFEPELVIMADRQADQVPQFRGAGMTVFATGAPSSLDEVYEQIELLGRITDHEDEAASVVEDMQSRIAAVEERLGDVDDGPRVFFELTPDLYTVAPDSFVGALLTLLKAQNVAEGAASQFPQLSNEAVLAADPEVIFLTDAEFGESLETVAARPGWDAVSAVVEERVYPLDGDLASRPGPRLAEAIEAMAAALYPELFE
jgi:iron complex transport system substrate-binding protein